MTTENKNEQEIRALMDELTESIRARDVSRLMPHYAPDVMSFDVVNPLRYTGASEIEDRMEQWFSSFEGNIGYEVSDLKIAAGADTAFCHGLSHVSATKSGGGKLDMWWRATIGFEKIEGQWKITHVHSSVPFDMETGLASLGLKP